MINIDELLNKIDVDKLIEDYGKKEPEHLDADGVPINIGDVLYFAGDKCAFPDRAYIVTGFEADYGVELKLPNGVLVYVSRKSEVSCRINVHNASITSRRRSSNVHNVLA